MEDANGHRKNQPTYTELEARGPLREFIECSWILCAGSSSEQVVKRVLPDGCIAEELSGSTVRAEYIWPDHAQQLAETILVLEDSEARLSAIYAELWNRLARGGRRFEPDRAATRAAELLSASPVS